MTIIVLIQVRCWRGAPAAVKMPAAYPRNRAAIIASNQFAHGGADGRSPSSAAVAELGTRNTSPNTSCVPAIVYRLARRRERAAAACLLPVDVRSMRATLRTARGRLSNSEVVSGTEPFALSSEVTWLPRV